LAKGPTRPSPPTACLTTCSPLQARDDFFALILNSATLKTTHGFRRAKELFEEDPRWKVRCPVAERWLSARDSTREMRQQ